MSENEPTQTAEAVETPTEEVTTESLDDIASSFNVEEQASQFQAQPQQPAPAYPSGQAPYQPEPSQAYTPGVPDPISDPEGYTAYMQNQTAQNDKTQKTLNEIVKKLSGYEESITQQKVDADVEKAASSINEKLGVDPKMAEIIMEMEYRDNPAFKKIWDNRAQNPVAFEKALGVVGDKWTSKVVNQADPQLAENVRAAKTSQQTMANAPKDDPDDKWSGLSAAEFNQKWSQERNG